MLISIVYCINNNLVPAYFKNYNVRESVYFNVADNNLIINLIVYSDGPD